MSGFGGVKFAHIPTPLFEFQFVEPGTQDFHGQLAIFVLAALVLALHDDARRQMREANGRFHFIDVLPAMAARTECINAEIFGLDNDLDAIVDFRNYEN